MVGPTRHVDLTPAPSLPFQEGERYVVVPYVPGMVKLATRRALAFGSPAPVYVALSPDDPFAYARLMLWLWAAKCTFVIVEHDIVPPVGAVRGLLECERPWCAHGYQVGGNRYETGLGLAKVSGSVSALHPDLARRALCRRRDGVLDVPWGSMDRHLASALQIAVGHHHAHQPDAVHLHEYDLGG